MDCIVQPLRCMYHALEITALSSHFSLCLNIITEADLCRALKVAQSTCYLGFLFLSLHLNNFQKGSLECPFAVFNSAFTAGPRPLEAFSGIPAEIENMYQYKR